jgi:hypothetical protein
LQEPIAQPPLEQAGVAFGVVQMFPHEPQLRASVRTFTSHPSVRDPLQSRKPVLQITPQVLELHDAMPFVGVGHAPAHEPQWRGSVARFASQPSLAMPLQSPKPVEQRTEHAPAVHTPVALAPPEQMRKQLPQLFVSLRRSRSQPFDASAT